MGINKIEMNKMLQIKCRIIGLFLLIPMFHWAQSTFNPEELVNPLMGTDSKYSFSNGNTYPAITMPWDFIQFVLVHNNMCLVRPCLRKSF